jgi:hypothetical protein
MAQSYDFFYKIHHGRKNKFYNNSFLHNYQQITIEKIF